MTKPKRLQSFDLQRLFFVLLALASHFRLSQGTWYSLQNSLPAADMGLWKLPYLATLTRSSISALLIIFGFMLEYVYARNWRDLDGAIVLEKMLTRALICYLAFASVSALATMAQGGTFAQFLDTALFAYFEHTNTFLFKYYSFLIPLAYLLIWLRFRFGFKWHLLLVTGLIAAAEFVKATVSGAHSPFELLLKNFLWVGNEFGPNVLHPLALVSFGRLAANYAGNKRLDKRFLLLFGMALLSAVALAHEVSSGFRQFVILMSSTKTYRAHNSYVYFAFGILSFSAVWVVCHHAVRRLGEKAGGWVSYYGGNTFLIFLYGNILLLSLAGVNAYYWASRNLRVIAFYNRLRLIVNRPLAAVFGPEKFGARSLDASPFMEEGKK